MRILAGLCGGVALLFGAAAAAHPEVSGHIVIHDGPVSIGVHLPPWHYDHYPPPYRYYPHYGPYPRRHAPWGHHGHPDFRPRPGYSDYPQDYYDHRDTAPRHAPPGHHHTRECYLFYEKRHPHWKQ